MYQCTRCKHAVEYTTNYCPICGAQTKEVDRETAIAEQQKAYRPPVYQPIQPEIPPQYRTEAPSFAPHYSAPTKKPNIAKRIVGAVLAIEGFASSLLSAFYVLNFFLLGVGAVTSFMTIIFAIICLPPTIIGFIMSKSCINNGDKSGLCRAGKILGLIGMIITIAFFVIGISGGGSLLDLFSSGYYPDTYSYGSPGTYF